MDDVRFTASMAAATPTATSIPAMHADARRAAPLRPGHGHGHGHRHPPARHGHGHGHGLPDPVHRRVARPTRSTPTSAAWPAATSSAATRTSPPCAAGADALLQRRGQRHPRPGGQDRRQRRRLQRRRSPRPSRPSPTCRYSNPFWVYIERLAEPGTAVHQRLLDQPALPRRAGALLPAVQQRDPRPDGQDRRQRGRLHRRHPLDAADVHRCAVQQPVLGVHRAGGAARRDQRLLDQPAVSRRRALLPAGPTT